MKYKAIGFDYGGVIIGIPSSEFSNKVVKILDVTPEIYNSAYFNNNHLFNHNILSRNDFWAKVLKEMNRSDKLDNLLKFLDSLNQNELNNKVLDLAKQLKDRGYKIGILSNNNIEAVEKMKTLGLMELFDVVVVSAEIGFSKPDPKAFDLFINQLNISPAELIFIDDTEKSLESSEKVGFYPILYNKFDKLRDTLATLGVI